MKDKRLLELVDGAINSPEPQPKKPEKTKADLRVADLATQPENFPATLRPHFKEYFDLCRGFDALAGRFKPDPADVDLLRKFQRNFEVVAKLKVKWSIASTARCHRDHRRELAELDPSKLADAQAFTRKEIEGQNREKMFAAKASMRRIATEARPVALRIMKAFGALAAAEASKIEAQELKNAELAGVEFTPSQTLQFVTQLAWRATEGCAAGTGSPQSMVALAGIKL